MILLQARRMNDKMRARATSLSTICFLSRQAAIRAHSTLLFGIVQYSMIDHAAAILLYLYTHETITDKGQRDSGVILQRTRTCARTLHSPRCQTKTMIAPPHPGLSFSIQNLRQNAGADPTGKTFCETRQPPPRQAYVDVRT